MTKEKLKFNEDMRQHAPPQQLWTEFQGDLEFDYEHSVYWPALLQLCEERRREQKEHWVKAGKHYGESEPYLKGGSSQSVGQACEPVPEATAAVEPENEETIPEATLQGSEDVKIPLQSSGAQANGNTDVMAIKPDAVLTTEGGSE